MIRFLILLCVALLSQSAAPSMRPSRQPSFHPTRRPTKLPTMRPTKKPTIKPTTRPSKLPTLKPTKRPSKPRPTRKPNFTPTHSVPPTVALPTTQTPSARPSTLSPAATPTQKPASPSPQPVTSCSTAENGQTLPVLVGGQDDLDFMHIVTYVKFSGSNTNIPGQEVGTLVDDDVQTSYLLNYDRDPIVFNFTQSGLQKVNGYTITASTGPEENDPYDWSVYGVVENEDPKLLDTRITQVFKRSETRLYSFPNDQVYQFYYFQFGTRFSTIRIGDNPLQIAEMELFSCASFA